MIPWIHLFSKFTLELLLIEFFFLFLFTCGYTLSWVLKKRKYGVIEGELPAGPVKAYIHELIQHAEELSTQLFGADSEVSASRRKSRLFDLKKPAQDLNAVRIVELEKKLADQHAILETTIQENSHLTQELESLKSKQQERELDQTEKIRLNNVQKDLSEKLSLLESRLAEYAIIEEDLADLKRYQQENSEMKRILDQNHIEFQTLVSGKNLPSSFTTVSSSTPESFSSVQVTHGQPLTESETQVRQTSTTASSSTLRVESQAQTSGKTQEDSSPKKNSPLSTSQELTPTSQTESRDEPRTTDAQVLAEFKKILK